MVLVGTEWAEQYYSPCTQNNLPYSHNLSRGFGSAMQSRGHQWVFDWGNGNAWEIDWREEAFAGAAHAPGGGVDTVDFAYLSTHGGGSTYFVAAFSNQHNKCLWDNREARLGNGRLKWVVLDTCHSVQLPSPHNQWHHAFHGLHMVLGFTGTAHQSWWTNDRGWDFGVRAGAGQILSTAWVDEAYSWWCDDDPAVIACGRNAADAQNRLYSERITSNYDSIPHNQIAWYWWRWRS